MIKEAFDIRQVEGKITGRQLQVIGEDADTLMNVLYHTDGFEVARDYYLQETQRRYWKIVYEEAFKVLGKSNFECRHLESAPGLWIFEDYKARISWYMYSDLHHKHPWKGTSFELRLRKYITGEEMKDALERFFNFLDSANQ